MTTALATTQNQHQRASALAVMASRFHVEPLKLLETLKATAFKGANDQQMQALVIVANEYGLNPFTKQIYAFPGQDGGITPVVSVDGWIKLMNDQSSFDGIEFETVDADGKPVSCTVTIFIKNRSRPVKVTEYFSECAIPSKKPWQTHPRRMLRHKALIQGVRIAFGLSGIYDEDDAEVIAGAKPIMATVVAAPPKTIVDRAPSEEEKQQETNGRKETEKPVVTERATPLQGVRNLIAASGVTEMRLIAYLVERGAIQDAVPLENVPDEVLRNTATMWAVILPVLLGHEHDVESVPTGEDPPAPAAEKPLERELVVELRELMGDEEITEDQLMAYAKAKKFTGKSLGTMNEGRLNWLRDNFANVAADIKGGGK